MQETSETQICPLGLKNPLEKGMATHSVFLPGESHGQRSLLGYKSTEWHRGGHDWSDLAHSTHVIKGGELNQRAKNPRAETLGRQDQSEAKNKIWLEMKSY